MTTLFRRLFASYMVIILVTLAVLGLSLAYFFGSYHLQARRQELVHQGVGVARLIQEWITVGRNPQDLIVALDAADRLVDARIWVVDTRGLIFLTSAPHRRWQGDLLDPDALREVMQGHVLVSTSDSNPLNEPTLTVTVPIRLDEFVVGAVLLHAPLRGVQATVSGVNNLILRAGIGAILLAMLLGFSLSRRISRPLREMAGIAGDMAEGRFGGRVDVASRDEVGRLATSFNRLAERLSESIDALTLEKRKAEAVLASMTDGVVVVETSGTVVLLNEPARRLLGLAAESSGKLSYLRFPGQLAALFTLCFESGAMQVGSVQVGEHALAVSVAPVKLNAAPWGVVALLHDVSESERLEQMRRRFVADVSHELRTPLTALRGYLQAIHDGVVREPQEIARSTRVMLGETLRLIRLVNHLLELSKIDSGRLALDRGPVDLAQTVDDLLPLFDERVRERGVTVEVDLPPELPPVDADVDRLNQIFTNLLDNALRHARPQDVVRIAAVQRSDAVEVTVADTGPGIPAADLPHIFERFYKVDKARASDGSGTGLGLVIVKDLVELHGGLVRVQSEPTGGTAFVFSLPVFHTAGIPA